MSFLLVDVEPLLTHRHSVCVSVPGRPSETNPPKPPRFAYILGVHEYPNLMLGYITHSDDITANSRSGTTCDGQS